METNDFLQKYARGRRNFQSIELCDEAPPPLRDRTLCWQDLQGIDLSYADCRMSIFAGADFTAAYLIETNFSRSDLTSANLYHANLCGADLSMADLRGACLVSANLLGANLHCASLTGADLSGAIMPNGIVMPENIVLQYKQAMKIVDYFC